MRVCGISSAIPSPLRRLLILDGIFGLIGGMTGSWWTVEPVTPAAYPPADRPPRIGAREEGGAIHAEGCR